jgi:predicted ATPase/DNA-binding winged helix-turn-helix (wHTH) protein
MITMLAANKDVFSFGPFRLTASQRLLTRQGTPVELGARALDILIALVSKPNEAIGKNELLSQVWPDVTVGEHSLRFHVASLRRALGDGKDGARYITTLAGRGYCFVAPVSRSSEEGNAARPAAADLSYGNLPGRLAHMIGRDEDVLRISTHLLAARFVSIVGVGGVGKTTVAIAVGHHLFESFAGAVLLVDLSALKDPGLVATVVASMLGLSIQSQDATPAVIAHLRSKRMLLILDTCEHLIDNVAALASRIYAKTSDVHILATSREVLKVEGEYVYRLDTLTCPPEDSEVKSEVARTFPAPRLFIERAAASGARRDLNDADAAVVVRICRKLDGVALAIELAARRVETYGLQQTETLLDQHLTLLLLGHRSATPRQKTLQATLDWSYQLLSELERVVLRRLAVFVGHFALDAALAIVAGTDIDQLQALGAIESLVGKSMIVTGPIGAMMRYRLLDTTRAYLLNLAIDATEAADLAMRHAAYYRRWLEQSGSEWPTLSTGPERSPHFAALNNARSALEWCFGEGGDVNLGIRLAAAAAPVFMTMSLLPESHRWSERAIAALDDATRGGVEEMQLQASLGAASMPMHGGSEAAHAALDRSLAIAETCGNIHNQVAVLRTLAVFCTRYGEFNTALGHAKRAHMLAGTIEEPDVIALGQLVLGMLHHFMGDLGAARSELEAAYKHSSRAWRKLFGFDDRTLVGLGLARVLWGQGFPTQAVEEAHRTLDDAQRSNNPASLAVILSWIPGILIWVGDLRSAQKHVDWLMPHAESHSLSPYLHVGRAYKAVLAICRGNAKAGVEDLRECLNHLHAMHYNMRTTEFKIFLTQGLIVTGQIDEGKTLIDETIRCVEESGEHYFLPEALRVKGRLLLSMPGPDSDAAEACFAQSLDLSRRQGARAWELRTAIDLATLQANRCRPEDGRKLLQPILEQFTEGRDTADQRTAERLLRELGQVQ